MMINYSLILISLIPLILVCIMVYFLLNTFTEKLLLQQKLELKVKNQDVLLPQRYQAYERMALFLERIRPTSLVRRVDTNTSLKEYERAIVFTIQEEFEHNLSQQIYINPDTWKIIFSAKNATQNFVKQCSETIKENGTAKDLQAEIIKRSLEGTEPSSNALLKIKGDIQGSL